MHPVTWVIWLAAVVIAISITHNPLYLVVLVLLGALLSQGVQSQEKALQVPISPLRFTLFLVPVTAVFNTITSNWGTTILLPEIQAPWFPALSYGPLTVEALVYGAINGLVLSALFTVFTVFNVAVPVRDLIRFIPRAFYPVAVVVSIALTFAPVTLRQLRQIREAQAVRGHRMRGIRDWLPLFIPLLTGGLERAFQLAESMTARGFSASSGPRQTLYTRLGLTTGLVALLVGLLLDKVWNITLWGRLGMALGAGLILTTVWSLGKYATYTVYRQHHWSFKDSLVLSGILFALGTLWILEPEIRAYTPYPTVTLPAFNPLVGSALLGFLSPLLVYIKKNKTFDVKT
ncbi:MAG: energy-coupling factor transporter transmembrane protein EcfT [Anaerolineae bacterium]|nr:energy-coupling factor transporter transmembrane protein EcfT [Anaerolineae bacterium]